MTFFPPLGDTGEGPVVHRGQQGNLFWQPVNPYTGAPESWDYYVTLQEDHRACAFRCHYPGGSAPCDNATAWRFIYAVQDALGK